MYLYEDLIAAGLKEVTGTPYETDADFARSPSVSELDKYFRECGDANFAKSGYQKSVSWCGMFAAYLLVKVGARVKWKMGKGIQDLSGGYDVEYIHGNKGIERGDIAIRGTTSHHFIVLETPASSGGIKCVEGNSGGTSYPEMRCGRRAQNSLGSVYGYYRVY